MAIKQNYTYRITSDIGKTVAQNMRAGDTHTASDGSTWRKNRDGSISVTTKSGNTYGTNYGTTRTGSKPAKKTLNTVYNQSTGQLDDASVPEWLPKAGDMAGYGSSRPIGSTGAITSSEYYDKMLAEQQRAIQERINAAVQANNAYIPQVDQQSNQALQNAYISREQARTRAPQALAALGYTGGAAESSMLGIDTGYENTRNTIEQERSRALEGIRQNEAQIRSTGDATLLEAAQSYYNNLVAAAERAQQQAQEQANWEAEFAMQQQQYGDAAAQQAWQNAYEERALALRYAPETQANYTQAIGANEERAKEVQEPINNPRISQPITSSGLPAGDTYTNIVVMPAVQNLLANYRSGKTTRNELESILSLWGYKFDPYTNTVSPK